jgi:single-strand DNA-binding protein
VNELLTQLIQCNQWRFIGRLGADPEMRFLESGLIVCNARLLVNKPGQKRDDGQKPYGFKLELWNEKAQQFADAAGKGDLLNVQGRVKTESWDDRQTGEKRHALVVSVESWEVLAKPGQGQQQAAAPASAAAPATRQAPAWSSSAADNYVSDEEVPF